MLETIKKLRDKTSLGINECKKALAEAGGDFDKALGILKERGIKLVEKRSERKTSQGIIDSYIHFDGKLGAIIEVNCETDFVARNEMFRKFVKDMAMQVAAVNPKYVRREDIPEDVVSKAANVDDYVKEVCLLEQAFVKDSKKTVKDYLQEVISQTGENIVINRFSRFSLGE